MILEGECDIRDRGAGDIGVQGILGGLVHIGVLGETLYRDTGGRFIIY